MSISIGQKQLLAIARLLIHKSKVIILDEATSNIDVETERKIQESLQEVMEGKISIIIAHRLSTIKKCDKIIVIKNGSIKESGTHEELLEKNGDYTELYKKQFE
jgi:ABC-type multidrug transport system fused ATPase/permease subunit